MELKLFRIHHGTIPKKSLKIFRMNNHLGRIDHFDNGIALQSVAVDRIENQLFSKQCLPLMMLQGLTKTKSELK